MTFQPRDIRGAEPGQPPLGASDLRQFIRRSIAAKGWIRYARKRHPVKMINLSEQGCQFWLPLRAGLPVGAVVALGIDKLTSFPAVVRWHRDGWTGVEFDLPIYLPVLDHLHDSFETSA